MLQHTRIALICGAPIENPEKIKQRIAEFPCLIAVNGGMNHCKKLGIRPNLIVGDLDSADSNLLGDIPVRRYPKDKDQTDLEIALGLISENVQEMTIFGALQGRTDHILGNLILLSRYPGKAFLESENERLFVIDEKASFATYPGQIISLIPLNGPVKGIHAKQLKWPLVNRTLDKQFIGISNEALETEVVISVGEGDLLCCINTV
jgi:thiamine pyrophosphokinase